MSTETLERARTSAPGKPRATGRPRGTSRLTSKATVNAVLLFGVLYTMLPMAFVVLASLKSPAGLISGDVFSLHDLGPTSNFSGLVHTDGGIFFRWYLNSILYAGVGAIVTGLVCVAAGYAFDKYSFRGKERLYALVLLGVLVPGTATTLPLYLLANKAHLDNTIWAVLIPSFVSPFGVFLARVFSQSYVPNEILEAARIDGAGDLGVFRSIALPLLGPGFATIALFQFSAIWNGFYLPYVMLNNQKLYPVSLGLYIWSSQISTDDPTMLGQVMTGSALTIIPIIVLFICLQRYWRSGLTAGALK
ncbi:carbohydrate ABC transporter permease [Actinospica sp.]|uniref:carbohydrate ABC transporter permease n=1 Tax=Actinospica sp. TaxID=1872142 RepID=UPI002BEDFFA1|nr:carbohydrate ABC transporter permease [Actinospica sp.]HWG26391.1 carbohydrate ABC transporter permease [Actinospica sp.]